MRAPRACASPQGCQIGLGALLMTVVGGGSPSFSAANPGLGKWLNGAIGLPVVRARSPARMRAASRHSTLLRTLALRSVR
jgi:hypothetical protein